MCVRARARVCVSAIRKHMWRRVCPHSPHTARIRPLYAPVLPPARTDARASPYWRKQVEQRFCELAALATGAARSGCEQPLDICRTGRERRERRVARQQLGEQNLRCDVESRRAAFAATISVTRIPSAIATATIASVSVALGGGGWLGNAGSTRAQLEHRVGCARLAEQCEGAPRYRSITRVAFAGGSLGG